MSGRGRAGKQTGELGMALGRKSLARFRDPVFRYGVTYTAVFSALVWSHYAFSQSPGGGNALFTIMPIVGGLSLYLSVILFADEVVALFGRSGPVAFLVKGIKSASFAVVGLYGVLALGLWVNGFSGEPVIPVSTRILSISTVDLGVVRYRRLAVNGWGHDGRVQHLLLTDGDQGNLYVGQDILLTLRKGALSLFRVLEIQEDMEQYYLKMVKAAPDSKIGMKGLIRIYAKRGAVDAALQWYDALLASYPMSTKSASDWGDHSWI